MRRGALPLQAVVDRFGTPLPDLPQDDTPPWSALALATFGALLAGAALVIAVASMFAAFDLEAREGCFLGGLLALGGGIVLSRAHGSVFVRQFALTGGVAGHALLTTAVVITFAEVNAESLVPAAVAAWVVAGMSWPLMRDTGTYRFVTAGAAMALTAWAMLDQTRFGPLALAALTVPLSLWLLLAPPRRMDLRTAAIAVLLVPLPLLGVPAGHDVQALSAAPYAAGALWLLWPVLRGHAGRMAVGGGGLVALTALLPGAAAALMLLALAWRVGSRVLAGLGVAALLGFVVHFYYAMEVTLLLKSGLLLAGGVVTLGLWAASRRAAA
ncbi:DUF4401 domain-containing protein [Novispirillum sp. DQ9]|uniref:DUF4401 domain-containing protein n=1 Tax=Novispirillum sp. DQ9 TaxID=3398612 RepID=UPI003C7A8572